MKKFTKIATVATFSLGLSVSAMAAENVGAGASLADESLSYAFDDSQNLQAVAMSTQEMEETKGAWAPLIYYGAVYGVPASFAVQRWAMGPSPQIMYHRIKNWNDSR